MGRTRAKFTITAPSFRIATRSHDDLSRLRFDQRQCPGERGVWQRRSSVRRHFERWSYRRRGALPPTASITPNIATIHPSISTRHERGVLWHFGHVAPPLAKAGECSSSDDCLEWVELWIEGERALKIGASRLPLATRKVDHARMVEQARIQRAESQRTPHRLFRFAYFSGFEDGPGESIGAKMSRRARNSRFASAYARIALRP